MPKPLRQRISVETDGYNKARQELRQYSRDSRRQLDNTSNAFTRTSRRMSGAMRAAMSTVVAYIGTQVVGAISRATRRLFEMGTAAEETASKFNTVFGSASSRVNAFLDDFIQKTSLTTREAQDFAAAFGGLFTGVDAATEQAAELSEQMVQLAGDLASFNNVPIQQALEALRSGLIGETEPLRQLNITFRQLDANAAALAQTGKDSADDLTELERVIGRIAVITDRAGVQIGDLDRTLDSTQNRARRVRGVVNRLVEGFAAGLIPVFEDVIGYLEDLTKAYEENARIAGEDLAGGIQTIIRDLIKAGDALRTTIRLLDELRTAEEQTFGDTTLDELTSISGILRRLNKSLGFTFQLLLSIKALGAGGLQLVGRLLPGLDEMERFNQEVLAETMERIRAISRELARQDIRAEQRDQQQRVADRYRELTERIEQAVELGGEAAVKALEALEEEVEDKLSTDTPVFEAYRKALLQIAAARRELRESPQDEPGPGPGGDTPGDRALQQADEALRKIQRAQELRATFTDEQRKALQEVFQAEEEIARLKEIQATKGEEAVQAELEAAQARLQHAREALATAEAFRRATAEAAHALNDMPLGRLGAAPGPDTSGRTFTVGEGEDTRTFFGSGALQGPGLSPEEIKKLERAVAKYNEEAEKGSEATEELGAVLQNVGSAVRSVRNLVNVFGDLSDEAVGALNGISDMVDGIGRLIDLKDSLEEGEGFADLFSGESIGQSLLPTIGVATGAASLIASALSDNSEQLRKHLDQLRQNARALEENTQAIFQEAQIGSGVSEDEIQRAQAIISELQGDLDMSSARRQNLIAELGEIPGLGDLPDVAQDLWDTLSETFVGQSIGRQGIREIINRLLFGGADPERVGDIFDVDLEEVLGEEFETVSEFLDRLSEDLGTFSDTVGGAAEKLRLLQENAGLEGDAAIDSFLNDVLGVEGLSGELKALLEEALALDVETEPGRQRLQEIIAQVATALASGSLSLGSLTPDDVEQLLDVLRGFTEGGEEGGDEAAERRTVQVARTITEFQANELLAYQQEQVLLLREVVRAVAGAAALARVGASTATGLSSAAAGEALGAIRDNTAHLAEIRDTLNRIAANVPSTRPPAVPREPRGPSRGGDGRGPRRIGRGDTFHITVNGAGDSPERIVQKIEDRVRRKPLR